MSVIDARFRRWIYLVLILAALLRTGFLVFGDVLPVMWDARRYASAALGLISFTYDPVNIESLDDKEDVAVFNRYYDRYINGEKIDWQFYPRPGIAYARDELFFSGPLYPAVLATVFVLSPVADFTIIRVVGIIFDLLATLLVMLLAFRLVGRRAALVAGLLYAIYFPFVNTSTLLLLETSTSFYILLGIYLMMRGVETDRRWYFVTAGIIAGLMVMNKPTAMLIGIPFVIGLYFYTRPQWKFARFFRAMLLIALPVVVLFGSWLAVTSFRYGELLLRDPTYAGANLRQSSSVAYEGYDLDAVEDEFWERKVYDDPLSNWQEYLGLFAKKFERLWSRPYNDFKRTLILPLQAVEWLHAAIITLGLFGLSVLLLRTLSLAAWPILICGYYTAIHLIFHSINRYSFNAFPFVMIGAAYMGVLIFDRVRASSGRATAELAASIGFLLTGWLLEPSWVNALFDTGLTEQLVTIVLCFKLALWLVSFVLLARLFLDSERLWKRTTFVATLAITFVVMSWVPALSREAWSEFECRLDGPEHKAGRRIYMSNFQEVAKGEALELLIDVNASLGRKSSFTISVCDWQADFVLGKRPLMDGFYSKPHYMFFGRYEAIGPEVFRQYASLVVTSADIELMLSKFGYLDISVAINDNVTEPNSYMTIYGKHPVGGQVDFIPTPTHSAIERYVHRGDPRIRVPVKFMSDSSISYYIGRNKTDVGGELDLSPTAGKQTGRFNIYLIHFKQDGSILVY